MFNKTRFLEIRLSPGNVSRDTLPDDARRISRNLASLNTLVHDV